ncbi:MAG: HNH endonuclease [Candidatus Sifarchaeia archaeon]
MYRYKSEWRDKSKDIQQRDNHTCSVCGWKSEDGSDLDVHHTYPLNSWIDDGHDPSEYPENWLMTLCKSCHSKTEAGDGVFKIPPIGE